MTSAPTNPMTPAPTTATALVLQDLCLDHGIARPQARAWVQGTKYQALAQGIAPAPIHLPPWAGRLSGSGSWSLSGSWPMSGSWSMSRSRSWSGSMAVSRSRSGS